ncbi:MAG TPA: flagellar filament capping protein FliD [Gaiellales bacterium]|nr:flagellar filament capping protein FliD [Gaiellales bacterium]
MTLGASSGSSSASPLFNISGLASGIDTNSIVSQLMLIERQPQVRLQNQQTVEQARQQALRDVNTRLSNLQDAIAALRDPGTWGDQQSVDSSDPTHVTAIRTGGAAAGGYQISVTRLARAQQLTQGTSASSASADGTLTIAVGSGTSVDVSLSAGDSLQAVADKVNGSSGSPVYATVVNGKLVLSSKATGAANTISVTGSSAADFGFAESQSAQDASYSIDGVSKTSSSNTVTDGLAGVSFTLKGVTSSPVSLTIGAPGPDTAGIQAKVQAFIDQYNSTIDFVQSKLTEKPVTNANNNADRAKGVLYGDSGLQDLLANLRSAVATPVSGRPSNLSMLSQVGVSTGAAVGTGALNQDSIAGKLTLDSAALTTALTNSFADTKALFTNSSGTDSSLGMGQRLNALVDGMTNASTGILTARINDEQSTIDDLKRQSDDMNVRLTAKEASLRAQYTAMETALAQAQSQGQYLSSQLARLG